MGSGELTATMVEVHKGLLQQLPGTPRAVFLDTRPVFNSTWTRYRPGRPTIFRPASATR